MKRHLVDEVRLLGLNRIAACNLAMSKTDVILKGENSSIDRQKTRAKPRTVRMIEIGNAKSCETEPSKDRLVGLHTLAHGLQHAVKWFAWL